MDALAITFGAVVLMFSQPLEFLDIREQQPVSKIDPGRDGYMWGDSQASFTGGVEQ